MTLNPLHAYKLHRAKCTARDRVSAFRSFSIVKWARVRDDEGLEAKLDAKISARRKAIFGRFGKTLPPPKQTILNIARMVGATDAAFAAFAAFDPLIVEAFEHKTLADLVRQDMFDTFSHAVCHQRGVSADQCDCLNAIWRTSRTPEYLWKTITAAKDTWEMSFYMLPRCVAAITSPALGKSIIDTLENAAIAFAELVSEDCELGDETVNWEWALLDYICDVRAFAGCAD